MNGQTVPYRGTYRAGVIGHTGQGNYGHGLDTCFVGLPRVTTVAVADPDDAGRQRTLARAGAARGYAGYHEMLERERLDVVAVGPSHLHEHEAMVLAAVRAGVKAIYCEKPLARSLDEADRLLAACDARGVKLAVAHQNRACPAPWRVRELIADGAIGQLRLLRAWPKQDARGGGLELLIHGTHLFDLMRFFAGDARWCDARVCVEGREATPADVTPGSGETGLIAGDDIVATYGFDGGVTGTFESIQSGDGGGNAYLRMEACGTGGILAFWSGLGSPLYYYPRPFALPDRPDEWQRVALEEVPVPPDMSRQHPGNQTLVADLLAAVEAGRPPLSSGHDARAALEMILAAYASHIQAGRVPLPLAARTHPLTRWTAGPAEEKAQIDTVFIAG
ncbi:MAG: Gfo/Idh/MocA family oxidoreductase [Chloroflexi bacterium]|nr:Gfo/Idh/MocA family oxidoreductase [Chloroflexota bacterium]